MKPTKYAGYSVDEQGNLLGPRKVRKWQPHPSGYLQAMIRVEGRSVNVLAHRIIAEAFVPNPHELPFVNHRDGDKQNNAVGNLEWCDSSANTAHAVATGLIRLGSESKKYRSNHNWRRTERRRAAIKEKFHE